MSVPLSLWAIFVSFLICISEAQYDGDSYEEKMMQDEFLSPRTQLARLFSRLQTIDKKLPRSIPRLPSSRTGYDLQAANPLYYDSNDDISDSQAIGALRKRQSSTGAQICIWKVCPPSPWRRAGKPGLDKSVKG